MSSTIEPTSQLNEIKNQYQKDGYIRLNKLLDRDTINQIRDAAKQTFDIQMQHHHISDGNFDNEVDFEQKLFQLFNTQYDAFLGAAKASQHILPLQKLGLDDRLINAVHDVGVENPIVCVKPIIYFNSPHLAKIEGHYKTPAHQDWRSMQGSLDSVIVWVALCDIDISLGALEIIPGSHLWGLQDTVEDSWYRTLESGCYKESDFVPVEVKAGDALVFSSFLVHRSGNNVTNHIRWSVHCRYNNLNEATFIERGFPHPYVVYRPNQDLLTPDFPSKNQLESTFKL